MGAPLSIVLRPLAATALLALCLTLFACGGDSSSSGPSPEEQARQERESVREAREERENQAMEEELKAGDYISCGGKLFVSKRSLCTFGRNVQHAYYSEVAVGRGKAIGYEPQADQDYRVLCSGTVPHKCTGFKGNDPGIESLKSGVIFFSP